LGQSSKNRIKILNSNGISYISKMQPIFGYPNLGRVIEGEFKND